MKVEEVPNYPGAEENLTTEEERELAEYLASGGYPKQKENNNMIGFFKDVFKSKDTTKAGNLTEEEILATRTLKATASYAKEMKLDKINEFINQISEDIFATSLSRDAKLLDVVVTSKKSLSTESSIREEKKKKWLTQK